MPTQATDTTPIKTVLFGLGKMGGFHLKTLRNDPRFDVVAIVEPTPKPAEVTGDIRQVASAADLPGIPYDAAVIASATASHYELAEGQLKSGKHLLVEKPLSPTPAEASNLIDLAKASGLKLAVGHVERSNPAIILAESLLATAVIGDVIHGTSQRGGGYPAGQIAGNDVLIDLAVHDLDVFSYLLGEQSFAGARCHAVSNPGVIDVAEVQTQSDNAKAATSATNTAIVNWLSPHRVRELRLIGSEGVMEVDYLAQTVSISGFHVNTRLTDASPALAAKGELSTLPGGCEQLVFAAIKQDALAHQLDQFHRYLAGQDHRLCAGERTADTIAICQQAKEHFQRSSPSPAPAASDDQPQTKPTELN